jgi:biotin operon repressor
MTDIMAQNSSHRYYLKERHAEAVIKMKEVLERITRPTSVAEIARQTGFNRVTVEKHVSNILRNDGEGIYKEIGSIQLGNSLVYYRKSERELSSQKEETSSEVG